MPGRCGGCIAGLPALVVLTDHGAPYVRGKIFKIAQGTCTMTRIRAFAARLFTSRPRFSDVAIGDMTDSQMRRTGLSKAEVLHRTFSGLSTCN